MPIRTRFPMCCALRPPSTWATRTFQSLGTSPVNGTSSRKNASGVGFGSSLAAPITFPRPVTTSCTTSPTSRTSWCVNQMVQSRPTPTPVCTAVASSKIMTVTAKRFVARFMDSRGPLKVNLLTFQQSGISPMLKNDKNKISVCPSAQLTLGPDLSLSIPTRIANHSATSSAESKSSSRSGILKTDVLKPMSPRSSVPTGRLPKRHSARPTTSMQRTHRFFRTLPTPTRKLMCGRTIHGSSLQDFQQVH